MCGIFGILASNCSISKTALERATDSLAHRGPDDKGAVVIQAGTSPHLEIGLGKRLLAILDLSPLGHQPMLDAETGNWIVQRRSLQLLRIRARLQTKACAFGSQSNTEVLLKAYGRGTSVPRRTARHLRICDLGCEAISPATGRHAFWELTNSRDLAIDRRRMPLLESLPAHRSRARARPWSE
jgi:asparagine synthetase B (glutamine-hydrolysing)